VVPQPQSAIEPSQPRDLRLFVALELPAAFKEALARVMEELRRAGASGLRWVRPEGIHLTLKFLGSVAPARLPAIEAALQQAVPSPFTLTLTLDQLGTFGGPTRTRVVWAGVSGPHLTLARVADNASPAERRRISELVQAVRLPPLAPLPFTEVSLMQSFLQPGGAVYQCLRRFPTAGPLPTYE
jgi:2'-5' RNA ligase